MVKNVLSQLLPLVFVSIIVSLVLSHWGVNYAIGALAGVAIQFVGFYAFRSILTSVVALKNKQLENERIKELSFQGLEVVCPCFKQIKEFVPIKLNTTNYYKCTECKKTIGVVITPETAIVTEPQDSSLEAVNKLLVQGILNAPKSVPNT